MFHTNVWDVLDANTSRASTTYTHDHDLAPGVRLEYRVSAINEVGAGEPSTVANAITQAVSDTAGNGAPDPTGITVNGTRVVLTFDENLDANSTPSRRQFLVTINNGRFKSPQSMELMGATVVLTLAEGDAVDADDVVDVRYTRPRTRIGDADVPTASALQDTEGNLVDHWNRITATNLTPPPDPEVNVNPTTLTVQEGSSNTYTVVLASEPTDSVVIDILPGGDGDVSVRPSPLTFDTFDWRTPQTVTVFAARDDDSTDDSAPLDHEVSSNDPDYNRIEVVTVAVTVAEQSDAPRKAPVLPARSARPVGLKVTAVGPDSISLSWKPSPHEEERSGYGIYRCTASEDMPDCDPYDGLWLAYLETNTYTDNEITPGTTYRYQVAAGALGRKNLSTRTLTVVAQPTETSSAPSGLTVTEASESVIRLSWTAPEEDGRGAIEAYDIYRCNVDSSPDCSGGFLHLASRNPVLTHYKDNNDVETGTTYRYAVAAYRWTEDVVPWSNQVTALAQREVLSEPEISVADAQAGEGPDSMLTFSVTLDPVPSDTVNVDYATSDGTATAGQDYTAAGGTLTFSDGEAAKTVTVTVLDDSHDEGSETLTLTLSNASGARIADGQATGTIVNSDPMPKDWLARFGRTSAMQVVGIMNARFDEVAAPIPQLTLGGQPMYLSTLRSGQENPERPTPVAPFGSVAHDGLFPVSSFTSPTSAGEAAWVHQDRTVAAGDGDANPLERAAWRLLTGTGDTWLAGRRQFLSRSSFNLSLSGMSEEPDMPRNETLRSAGDWSVWGRGALTHFAGSDAEVRLSGDVLTGLMGLDYARNRWLAGVALSYSDGDGAYHSAAGEGDVSSVLVSIHPYLRYALTGRLSVWGVLGYGQGEMRLEQTLIGTGPEDAMKTDMSMGMGAAGIRGIVYATADTELALKSDVLWVRTSSEATAGLAAVDAADASRVRLLLAGSHRRALANGAMLTPNFELGVRYDDGDAEDGVGMELGGGLHYVDPLLGLTVETRARALLAHEDGSYEEWGLGGSVQVDPGRLRRGLSLHLDTDWGITDSRAEALWQRQGTAGLARQHGRDQGGRVRAEWSYGLDVPWTYGILTPYSSVELADGGNRILRLGWRFVLGRTLSFSLDGERRETALLQPEHGLMLRLSLPW